jgi:hypothetical protein
VVKTILPALLFLCIINSSAQTVRTSVAAIQSQITAYSSKQSDVFSLSENQASLAGLKNFSIGFYGERRFMLQDLNQYKAAIAIHSASGNFGIAAGYFGARSYNESQLGLAYGRKLGKLDIGAQFNYFSFKASAYEGMSAINFEGGLILHFNDRLQTGIHIYNPVGLVVGKSNNERLPLVYDAGIGYDASEVFFLGFTIEKTEDSPASVQAGAEYSFDKKLFARAGISSGTSLFYIGTGVLLNTLKIDLTASFHPQLGITPGLTLTYHSITKP